ncbi:MAG: ferritin family protein [Bacteroidota bacterium]
MKNFKNTDDILDFAISREQEAVDFYTRLAQKARNKEMKQVFTGFAAEETGHKKRLQSIKESRQFRFTGKEIQDLKMSDYLVDMEVTPDMTYQNSLIVAMKREKAAFRLYMDLSDKITDGLLKNIFLSLAQEESKHKLRFELEYDEFILKEN